MRWNAISTANEMLSLVAFGIEGLTEPLKRSGEERLVPLARTGGTA